MLMNIKPKTKMRDKILKYIKDHWKKHWMGLTDDPGPGPGSQWNNNSEINDMKERIKQLENILLQQATKTNKDE